MFNAKGFTQHQRFCSKKSNSSSSATPSIIYLLRK
jgi:hypothetical protein